MKHRKAAHKLVDNSTFLLSTVILMPQIYQSIFCTLPWDLMNHKKYNKLSAIEWVLKKNHITSCILQLNIQASHFMGLRNVSL